MRTHLDRIIEDKERELAALYDRQQRAEQIATMYGPDDFADGTVITWKRRFDASPGEPVYSYAAIKVGDLWFTTGMYQSGRSWALMVEKHLSHAEGGVWYVTEWTEVER